MNRSWLWAGLLAGLSSVAHADVPPPPGYVEQCTLEKQKKEGEDCQTSRPWYRERDKGQREWGTKGYTRRCRTRGASVWTEIWCKAAEVAKPAEPAKPDEPAKAAEPAKVDAPPATQPSTPPAAIVLDAGGPPIIAPPDAGGTAPQPVPTAPKASEPGAERSKAESTTRKSRACSAGGGSAAAWIAGLALVTALARRRRWGGRRIDRR